ncbi:23S ribosomal RNA methyltransferase [Clavulina sp. PMI_390]|nr:23S ribosomal RNA methyltransferase [Clavulina sp. PMI_390]
MAFLSRTGPSLLPRLSRNTSSLNSLRYGSTSSNQWLQRQANDSFVRQRNADAFRSRSAYKLQEIDRKFHILRKSSVVIDLGAAPGGWSEYVAHVLRAGRRQSEPESESESESGVVSGEYDVGSPSPPEKGYLPPKIIAVDLLPIEPIAGVSAIKGNFLSRNIYLTLLGKLGDRYVDVVLSDMCANMSGNRESDIASSLELCTAALTFAQRHFGSRIPRGPGKGTKTTLVMKYFADPEFDTFKKTCAQFFERVEVFKPKSSRAESSEMYLICSHYRDAGE